MAVLNFDANDVKPNTTMEVLPEGSYKVAIVQSENKQNSKKNGFYLELRMQVLDGDHKGRLLFDRLNLDNPNSQAVEIAKGTLSAICHAVGVMTPRDSSELHNRPMIAKVKVRKREDNGEYANEVKGYSSLADAQTAVASAPSGAGPAPWANAG